MTTVRLGTVRPGAAVRYVDAARSLVAATDSREIHLAAEREQAKREISYNAVGRAVLYRGGAEPYMTSLDVIRA